MNNNILEFIVRMKDLMSSQLTKLATTGKNTFAKIDSNVKQTMTNIKFMGNSVNELRSKLQAVNEVRFGTVLKSEFRQATVEAQKLERQIAKLEGRQGGGRSMLGRAASFLGPVMIAGALMSFTKSSVKAAMDFDATRVSFGVLTGSKTVGNELAAKLRQLKQDTIMGPTVYKNAQTMLGFGITADKVVPTLKRLGDVSMGDADKLKRLTLAFSEVEAAGKLNGRRMLQFVNSGFNPLQEMARTTGKSMEQLTEMMKKGQISAEMLEGAFKSVTSAGGRFNNMLNVMAETPLGKMKRLEGQWAAFKIDVGEAIMPMAESAMEAGSKFLSFLNIHKTIPETLQIERASIAQLVTQITSLNGQNVYRTELMQKLKDSYPEFFAKLDTEKSTNADLLKILNDINSAYDKRINLASSDLIINDANKDLLEAQKNVIKYNTLIDLHNRGDVDAEHKMRSWADAFNSKKPFGPTAVEYYQGQVKDNQAIVDKSNERLQHESVQKDYKEKYYLLQQSLDVAKDSNFNNLFKTKEGKDIFLAEIPHIAALKSIIDNMDIMHFGELGKYDFDKLKKLLPSSVTAAGIVPKATDEGTKASGKEVASSMTSGGPRIININGVKFTDKIEIHAGTMTEGIDEMERKLQEYFLRILNSGASVQ